MFPDFIHEGEQSMSPWYQSLHPVHHSSSRSATASPGLVTPVTTCVSWQIPQHPNPSLSREQEEGLMFASDNICMLCKGSVLMLLASLSIFHLVCAHNESLLLWFCTSIPSKTCHGQNISFSTRKQADLLQNLLHKGLCISFPEYFFLALAPHYTHSLPQLYIICSPCFPNLFFFAVVSSEAIFSCRNYSSLMG